MSERPARQPQSHFDESYESKPPWDIDRPQPALLAVAEAGGVTGRVLDVGCGTGEHALMAAARGCDALGIDFATAAITMAEAKARDRGVAVRFVVGDALELDSLNETFDTVLDCGLFHVFDDADRAAYVQSLATATGSGARLYLLCFSDEEPGDWGPRRISQGEIQSSFANGWRVEAIEPSTLEITVDPHTVHGWLATITRV